MEKSVFDPELQQQSLPAKVVAGLERISEVFKVLLWDQAKESGLSPIQIQLLLFIGYHPQSLCNVSYLAREFNLTKPTISDAVKALDAKGLVRKVHDSTDGRRYALALSEAGEDLIGQLGQFTKPLEKQIGKLDRTAQNALFRSVYQLIHTLNYQGVLQVQRMCFSCKYYRKAGKTSFCNLLEKELAETDLRLDCPEFETRA